MGTAVVVETLHHDPRDPPVLLTAAAVRFCLALLLLRLFLVLLRVRPWRQSPFLGWWTPSVPCVLWSRCCCQVSTTSGCTPEAFCGSWNPKKTLFPLHKNNTVRPCLMRLFWKQTQSGWRSVRLVKTSSSHLQSSCLITPPNISTCRPSWWPPSQEVQREGEGNVEQQLLTATRPSVPARQLWSLHSKWAATFSVKWALSRLTSDLFCHRRSASFRLKFDFRSKKAWEAWRGSSQPTQQSEGATRRTAATNWALQRPFGKADL